LLVPSRAARACAKIPANACRWMQLVCRAGGPSPCEGPWAAWHLHRRCRLGLRLCGCRHRDALRGAFVGHLLPSLPPPARRAVAFRDGAKTDRLLLPRGSEVAPVAPTIPLPRGAPSRSRRETMSKPFCQRGRIVRWDMKAGGWWFVGCGCFLVLVSSAHLPCSCLWQGLRIRADTRPSVLGRDPGPAYPVSGLAYPKPQGMRIRADTRPIDG